MTFASRTSSCPRAVQRLFRLLRAPAAPQVIDVCRRANPRLLIKRAKFSALVRRELERSVQTLGLPDENASKAVDARQEIDLRIGASFTRFQTMLLQVCAQTLHIISHGGIAWNICAAKSWCGHTCQAAKQPESGMKDHAAFTHALQDKFDWRPGGDEEEQRKVISYGPCQFPTLGLIVQRQWCAHAPPHLAAMRRHRSPEEAGRCGV